MDYKMLGGIVSQKSIFTISSISTTPLSHQRCKIQHQRTIVSHPQHSSGPGGFAEFLPTSSSLRAVLRTCGSFGVAKQPEATQRRSIPDEETGSDWNSKELTSSEANRGGGCQSLCSVFFSSRSTIDDGTRSKATQKAANLGVGCTTAPYRR
ncbi:hypothetical protein F443_08026 [Phytophthora nicotianae P1569]|uniref:Uncharacterized protein n=1 Tax=Phytophthora nicotianae P1569 TaxID=1317065 RepID=V9F9P0_PHYNI|nr:hypothetical protein F443_08026 [Phytophthora nicotianae P1569]